MIDDVDWTKPICDQKSTIPNPTSLLGLAPGGGYLAARIAARAGGLLHHLFTLADF